MFSGGWRIQWGMGGRNKGLVKTEPWSASILLRSNHKGSEVINQSAKLSSIHHAHSELSWKNLASAADKNITATVKK